MWSIRWCGENTDTVLNRPNIVIAAVPILRELPLGVFRWFSVSAEQVTCVDLIPYVIQTAVIAVGNDGLTALFELLQVIYDFTAEEGAAIFQRRLVDDDRCAFGLINNEYLYF